MKQDYMYWGQQGQQNGEHDREAIFPPTVTIFGAGVAGLTAAHELIERGFNVNIVEPATSPKAEYACKVGGVAANQVGRVKIDIDEFKQNNPNITDETILGVVKAERSLLMQPVQRRFPITQKIQFDKQDYNDKWLERIDDYGVSNKTKLDLVQTQLANAWSQYIEDYSEQYKRIDPDITKEKPFADLIKDAGSEVLQVRVLGYTDSDGTPEVNREISLSWVLLVIEYLALESFIPFVNYLPEPRGAEKPLGNQLDPENRKRSNRVELEIVEQQVPGEHGYRFFPNFYRHIFDTMKRTPVFDNNGDLTAETAYNQLVPTPNTLIGFSDGKGLNKVELRRFTAIKAIQNTMEFFRSKAKFTDLDLLRLQIHLLKYLTSCRKRRIAEAEDVSFWEYIHADRVGYSSAAARFLDGAPQALVAMSAKETDARTQYNALIQMLFQNPLENFVPDMQLNGTTSEAWLDRWKDYLRRKGVKFFRGKLSKLVLEEDDFLPVFGPASEGEKDIIIPEEIKRPLWSNTKKDKTRIERRAAQKDIIKTLELSDFFVMAVPLDAASQLVWDACSQIEDRSKIAGPFRQLLEFDLLTGRRDRHGNAIPRKRSTSGRPAEDDPQRDISGVQYFIPQNYRIGDGYVYYADSNWGLSSISQLAFWRERIRPIGKYIGQASVDIGNWYNQYLVDGHEIGPSAWNSTKQELAEVTWNQAMAALNKQFAKARFPPAYYHVDEGIKFAEGDPVSVIAFRSNARLRISDRGGSYEIRFLETNIHVSTDKRNISAVPEALARQITGSGAAGVHILPPKNPNIPGEHAELLISPIKSARAAIVRITGVSQERYILSLDGNEIPYQEKFKPKTDNPLKHMRRVRDALVSKIPENYIVLKVGETAFRVESALPASREKMNYISLCAFNEDSGIEVVGLRMTLSITTNIDVQNTERAIVLDNANPYIINVPGQWRHRPGVISSSESKVGRNGIQYGSPNSSLFRRWIPAGTYLATCTRLTTMEAANESARHAVNAILGKLLEPQSPSDKLTYNGQGKLFGDFCDIWDPEDYEPLDLTTFKDLDTTLMREGLPHVFDIFRVIDMIEALPDDISVGDALLQIRKAMERQYELSIAASSLIGRALDSGIRAQIEVLHSLLSSIFH